MLAQEIQREQGGEHGTAEVDREDGPRPLLDHGDDIAHAEIGDGTARDHLLTGEVSDRDVHVAPHEGQEQHQEHVAAVAPDFGIGILEDSHLNHGGEVQPGWTGQKAAHCATHLEVRRPRSRPGEPGRSAPVTTI
jgi:hypothetical protein